MSGVKPQSPLQGWAGDSHRLKKNKHLKTILTPNSFQVEEQKPQNSPDPLKILLSRLSWMMLKLETLLNRPPAQWKCSPAKDHHGPPPQALFFRVGRPWVGRNHPSVPGSPVQDSEGPSVEEDGTMTERLLKGEILIDHLIIYHGPGHRRHTSSSSNTNTPTSRIGETWRMRPAMCLMSEFPVAVGKGKG